MAFFKFIENGKIDLHIWLNKLVFSPQIIQTIIQIYTEDLAWQLCQPGKLNILNLLENGIPPKDVEIKQDKEQLKIQIPRVTVSYNLKFWLDPGKNLKIGLTLGANTVPPLKKFQMTYDVCTVNRGWLQKWIHHGYMWYAISKKAYYRFMIRSLNYHYSFSQKLEHILNVFIQKVRNAYNIQITLAFQEWNFCNIIPYTKGFVFPFEAVKKLMEEFQTVDPELVMERQSILVIRPSEKTGTIYELNVFDFEVNEKIKFLVKDSKWWFYEIPVIMKKNTFYFGNICDPQNEITSFKKYFGEENKPSQLKHWNEIDYGLWRQWTNLFPTKWLEERLGSQAIISSDDAKLIMLNTPLIDFWDAKTDPLEHETRDVLGFVNNQIKLGDYLFPKLEVEKIRLKISSNGEISFQIPGGAWIPKLDDAIKTSPTTRLMNLIERINQK